LPLGIPRITRAGRSGLNIYRASAARANLANSGTNRLARFAKKTGSKSNPSPGSVRGRLRVARFLLVPEERRARKRSRQLGRFVGFTRRPWPASVFARRNPGRTPVYGVT